MTSENNDQPAIRTRDPERTSAEILEAALEVFATRGYDGAKVQEIAGSAGCNPRLIYHYYGNKGLLYQSVLRRIYAEIRSRENELRLEALPPVDAMDRLVEMTFDFFDQKRAFLLITRSENILGGRYIARLPEIQKMSAPLLDKIGEVLERGHQSGVFRDNVDPLQLYVSIVALSAHHINASHTLSATFGKDITDASWRQARRAHVVSLIRNALLRIESSL
jgi:AcrR family transcriptional regulator